MRKRQEIQVLSRAVGVTAPDGFIERIAYRISNDVDLRTTVELYRSSTLRERRPVDDAGQTTIMLRVRRPRVGSLRQP